MSDFALASENLISTTQLRGVDNPEPGATVRHACSGYGFESTTMPSGMMGDIGMSILSGGIYALLDFGRNRLLPSTYYKNGVASGKEGKQSLISMHTAKDFLIQSASSESSKLLNPIIAPFTQRFISDRTTEVASTAVITSTAKALLYDYRGLAATAIDLGLSAAAEVLPMLLSGFLNKT